MLKLINNLVRYGLYLFVFLLPLQTRIIFSQATLNGAPWSFGTVSLYATEILLIIILILGLLGHLFENDHEELIRRRVGLQVLICSVLVVLASLFSVLFAQNKTLAIQALLHLIEGVGLLMVLFHAEYSSHRLGQWFVGSMVIQGLLAIYQFFTQGIPASTLLGVSEKLSAVSGISVFETSAGRFLRAYGTFDHPNILAGYLVAGLVITMALFFSNRSKFERILLSGAQVVLTAGLFYTLSRSGIAVYLIVMVAILLYTVLHRKKDLRDFCYFSAGVSLLVLALLSFLHRDVVLARYFSPEIINTPSVTDRVTQYAEARELLSQHWYTGVGIGNYTVALSVIRPEAKGAELQPIHNIFILIFVETGILGIFILFFFFYELLKPILCFDTKYAEDVLEELEKYSIAINYEKDYGKCTHWFVCLSALIVGFIGWFLFDHYFWTLYSGVMLWWLVVGLWLKQLVRIKR